MTDIKSMLPEELEEHLQAFGEKKYRAMQIFSQLHKGVTSFDEMTDLPLSLRDRLSDEYIITKPDMLLKLSSKDGTVKYLWQMADGQCIESVLMEYKHGTTICVSTQAGCRMGCIFCASGIGGLARNLTPGEMLDQVLFSMRESKRAVSNIVLMGIGEPLDNYDNVMRFIRLVCHNKGLNIGARHLTLSTCGIIENIDRLADSSVKLSLAVSLHAPDDETRTRLIPYNRNTGVKALCDAAGRYFSKTGRRVTYEYAMINGVNDSVKQARMLSEILISTGSHLNLIILNPMAQRNLAASSTGNINAFAGVLTQNKVKFTTRRSLGADIDASCGQLRRKSPDIYGSMGNNS